MRRREFIAGLAGSVVTVPARAQQQLRRIGILWSFPESDPVRKFWGSAFIEGLHELGWTEGHNLRIESAPFLMRRAGDAASN